MAGRLAATSAFLAHLARDLAGTLRRRWSTWQSRVVSGQGPIVVGVDAYPFTEHMTGVGWYEWQLLEALDEVGEGLELNLYAHTFRAPGEPAAPALPGHRRMRLRCHHLPEGFLFPIRPTLTVLRRVVEPLLRLLDNNQVMFAPNFFLHRDQLPFGRSIVATVHDLAFCARPDTVAPETLRELESQLPDTLFRAERLIAVSDATASDLETHLGIPRRRIHTIHEGIDPGFATLAGSTPAGVSLPYLLFVSTLEPRKNVVGVLAAFHLLVEWGYPGQLVLVGRWGWRTEGIRDAIERSPARHRVLHLEGVERDQLPCLYRGADALLFPSWLEGFGLPILEAMVCGTPVVTSGSSSMPEVAGPAAVYVDPSSAHGIASAVSSLLADPQHRQRLVALGRERATRFSWRRAAAATRETLCQAAGLEPAGDDAYRV